MDIFAAADPKEVNGYLWFWCDMAMQAKIIPFQKFVAHIKSHWSGIVAYLDKKITNGITEGINTVKTHEIFRPVLDEYKEDELKF